MKTEEIKSLLEAQKAFFQTGATLPVNFRLKQLRKLYHSIKKHEAQIVKALRKDLGKSAFESYMSEIGLVLSEISYMLRHTEKFAERKRVKTPLSQFPASSFTKAIPYGNVLIISPWNYPFLLNLSPLVGAIAAGNTVVLKPSAYAEATAGVIEKIIGECFPSRYVAVVTGGRAENTALLEQKFDFIFFTGSKAVGKEVLKKAAEHLTPVILELGGKSPCIVDKTANLRLTARRIVFGKFLNCGQTCVAPDYILADASIKNELVKELKREVKRQFGDSPLENKNYGKIINEKHFKRLVGLIDPKKLVLGGEGNLKELRLAPVIMDEVSFSDAVMKEEIFGPILPIISVEDMDKAMEELKNKEKPLALYLFSEDRRRINKVVNEFSFGGGCINDVIIHLATDEMGFGGVGESGMGSYHGRESFLAFSHTKSMVDKKTWLDLPMRYQPYRKLYEVAVRLFLR